MSFDFSSLLGLPLSMAEARLHEAGLTLPVTVTSDPPERFALFVRTGTVLFLQLFWTGCP